MKNIKNINEILGFHKKRLVEKYGLNFIAVFGSYSRGEQVPLSDIDILVDFKNPIGLEFIDLAEELESILSNKIDLVSLKGIKPEYFKFIENDLRYVE